MKLNGHNVEPPRLWSAFARSLGAAGATHDFEQHILPRVLDGRAQYWADRSGRGAIVTEIVPYPLVRTLNLWLFAGELQACLTLLPEIEEWARREGCGLVQGVGRSGFRRVLEPYGAVPWGIAYRKWLQPS